MIWPGEGKNVMRYENGTECTNSTCQRSDFGGSAPEMQEGFPCKACSVDLGLYDKF